MERPKKLPEYTSDPDMTNGTYSHTKDRVRWYNLDWNQGHNEAIDEMQKWIEWLIDEEIKIIKKEYMYHDVVYRTGYKEALQELKRKVKE